MAMELAQGEISSVFPWSQYDLGNNLILLILQLRKHSELFSKVTHPWSQSVTRKIRLVIPNLSCNQQTPSGECTNKKPINHTSKQKELKWTKILVSWPTFGDPDSTSLGWDPHIRTSKSSPGCFWWLEVLGRTRTQAFWSVSFITPLSGKPSSPVFPYQPKPSISTLPALYLCIIFPKEITTPPDYWILLPLMLPSLFPSPSHSPGHTDAEVLLFPFFFFQATLSRADLSHSTSHKAFVLMAARHISRLDLTSCLTSRTLDLWFTK